MPSRSRSRFNNVSPRSTSASTTTGAPLSVNPIGVDIAATVLAAGRETAPPERGRQKSYLEGSGERLTATAGALRVRVVDREARALEPVLVVERRAHEVLCTRGVDDDL